MELKLKTGLPLCKHIWHHKYHVRARAIIMETWVRGCPPHTYFWVTVLNAQGAGVVKGTLVQHLHTVFLSRDG